MNQFYTSTDHFVVMPGLMLTLFGCTVLLAGFFAGRGSTQRRTLLLFTIAGLVFTGVALARQQSFLETHQLRELAAFQGALLIDRLSLFFSWIFLAAALVVALLSYRYMESEDEPMGEYYGLLLLAQAGMFFLATGMELVTLTVGLELMAVSFYILVGFLRGDTRSNEASMKYLLLGAFSTAFLLYGFSLLYGLSGSTGLREIATTVATRGASDPIVVLAMITTSVGVLFKISAAPFHMWAPDAYEGAPTPVTAYLSVASKAASFALLVRLFLGPLADVRAAWEPVLIVVAVMSLVVGNLAAVTQNNVKRLLAYSSISHAGYILLGLIAGTRTGIQGIAVYILVYTFMTLGAFAVVAAMHREKASGEDIEDLRGLIHRKPGYAIAMLLFMISLAGIPPTAGFLGKYYIFVSLIETGHYALAVIGALFVAVSVYYYLRIVKTMFTGDPAGAPAPATSFGFRAALAVTASLTLAIGLYPEPFLRFARILGAAA